jgi:hypothetical protein
MSEQTFDPRAFVLRKDIHPVELWSPGARVRIRVPAVPVAGTDHRRRARSDLGGAETP